MEKIYLGKWLDAYSIHDFGKNKITVVFNSIEDYNEAYKLLKIDKMSSIDWSRGGNWRDFIFDDIKIYRKDNGYCRLRHAWAYSYEEDLFTIVIYYEALEFHGEKNYDDNF